MYYFNTVMPLYFHTSPRRALAITGLCAADLFPFRDR